MCMMMMIMIAGFVDSITTPIRSWIDTLLRVSHDNHHSMRVKEVGDRVEYCVVCLSEVGSGERFARLERCGHDGFHVECVEAWLKDYPNCPLCRTPVSCANETVYLKKKAYETMSRYVLEPMATWLTASFTQSSLYESCTSYLCSPN